MMDGWKQLSKIPEFNEHFNKNKPIQKNITLTKEDMLEVKKYAETKSGVKRQEIETQKDPLDLLGRNLSGIMGELAVEKYLKAKFIKWNDFVTQRNYRPDLSALGLNIGVKTVKKGYFHLIYPKIHEHQILVFRDNENLIIGGLATIEVLKKYSSKEYCFDDAVKKIGFYGFEHLIPFESVEDLKRLTQYKKEVDWNTIF